MEDCQNMTFPFYIEKEQNIKTQMPSLELTQPWKIHTTLYQPDYLMNNKTYQDLINYLTTLTYLTDYDDKWKPIYGKIQPNTLLKIIHFIDEIRKVTYE